MGMARDLKSSFNHYEEILTGELSPELKLLQAVLSRALMDLGPAAPKKERRESINWFRSVRPKKNSLPFSMVSQELNLGFKMIKFIELAIKEAENLEKTIRKFGNANNYKQKWPYGHGGYSKCS